MNFNKIDKIKILTDKFFYKKENDYEIYYKGNYINLDIFNDHILDEKKISNYLTNLNNPFSIIFKNNKRIIASSDHNRTFPLFFFLKSHNELVIGDNPRKILENIRSDIQLNNDSIIQAYFSGYVLGNDTLNKNLYQILAGQYLHLDNLSKNISINTYYKYSYKPIKKFNLEDQLNLLDNKINQSIERTIKKANGATIFIPLSGGLDSRLIAGKLKEYNYKNIKTFSYGLKNNTEAVVAKKISKKLNIEWMFIESTRKEFKKIFSSSFLYDYNNFSDGLCAVPNIQEFATLYQIKKNKKIPDEIYFVNGQSGDFITGGHLDKNLLSKNNNLNTLVSFLINKHFSLWTHKNYNFLKNLLRTNLIDLFLIKDEKKFLSRDETINILLQWEHRERQSKYVINQQRAYEFFNYNWTLPLWDKDLINFWRTIPYDYLVNQKLYKIYLHKWNYKNIYSEFPDNVTSWSKNYHIFLQPLSILLFNVAPKSYKNFLNNFFAYFSRFGHLYSFIPMNELFKYSKKARNHISFFTRNWLLSLEGKKNIVKIIKNYKLN